MKYSAFNLLEDITEFVAYIAAVGLVLSNKSGSFKKRYGKFMRSIITILFIVTLVSVLIKLAYEYYFAKLTDPDNIA